MAYGHDCVAGEGNCSVQRPRDPDFYTIVQNLVLVPGSIEIEGVSIRSRYVLSDRSSVYLGRR